MNKIFYLATLLVLVNNASFCQSGETEPNNSFTTANAIFAYDQVEGTIGGGDAEDYHSLDFNYNGEININLELTNTGSNGPQLLTLSLFNSLQMGGTYVGNTYQVNLWVDEGSTEYFPIRVCGLAKDQYIIRMQAADDFEYIMEWYPSNTYNIDDLYIGYNDFPPYASPFTFNVEKEGSIGYKYWGNTNVDTVDYYTTILPAANYDSVELKIKASNTQCASPKWIQYFLYRNGSPTAFASGYVGGNPAIPAFEQGSSRIPLSNMQQGDNLLVKIVTNGTFGYSFITTYKDIYDDDEENCDISDAIPLEPGSTAHGNVGEYDEVNDVVIDECDTYKIVAPFPGSVKVYVTATNTDCDGDYYSLDAEILDRYGNSLDYPSLVYWDYAPCNTTITDTIKIGSFTADTFYLRIYPGGYGRVNYSIRYEVVDSTGNIDVEPNNTFNTAVPISPGEVKGGNVRFNTTNFHDDKDFYKGSMPEDGNIRVYLKVIYRGESLSGQISLVTNGYFTYHPIPNPGDIGLLQDSIYIDTFDICGIRKGDISFELRTTGNQRPFEYELMYEVTENHASDDDEESNNSFTEAKRVGSNSLQKGHVNYIPVNSSVADTYDYYKMVFTTTDSLKLQLQAMNVNCYPGTVNNRNIIVRGYNKNQSLIFARNIGNTTSVPSGATVTDSIKINVIAPDTIYVRFEANTSFKYQFTTNSRLPYSGFYIEGDTAICTGFQTYKAVNLADEPVSFHWSLPDGGGVLNFQDNIATVQWNTTGNRRIQLYLSNAAGNSVIKERTVIINGIAPTQVPVAYNFARTLSTSDFPPGATAKWYRNDIEIPGATNPTYYAADAGSYTVRFASDCGAGPASNAIVFADPALPQTISFMPTPPVAMSPTAFVKLNATASSGLPVYYQKVSGQGTIQNDTLFITGNNAVGNIIIKAMQPGDDVYSPAPDAFDTIVVVKGTQSITFGSIPDQILNSTDLLLGGSSSAGLPITYQIIAGSNIASLNNLSGANTSLNKLGAGTVTLGAIQNGNANYHPADPVEQSFCIGVRTLTPIIGDINPCLATYQYVTQKIPGANFEWTLSGGGALTTHNDTAWVQWQTPGTYILKVKANSPCDPIYTDEQEISITTSDNNPSPVTGMLPINEAQGQQLPLRLSWIPGSNTVDYDLYIWDSTVAEPPTPYASNITNVFYTIPANAFDYNKSYKWKIVSKNPCSQTEGPIQTFRLRPLADLVVSDVQAPSTANSGQTISISWKVTNAGPGRTLTDEVWQDAVFFSFDTMPNFAGSFNWDPYSWNALTAQGKPLVAGTKQNVAALDSGQFYTNSIDFTLPINYNQPLYVYVITNYPRKVTAPMQVTVLNDTARAPDPINVILSPTPDLRVDSVFSPTTTFSGSTINVTYKVKNHGVLTPVGSKWVDSIFISQSPLFERSQCIPLKLPKANGSYYPNAVNANQFINTQLQPDSSYTRNVEVVIPNFIFGTWFIYVKTNAAVSGESILYEGALVNNNVNRSQVEIFLTPTPKLTVNTLSVPITTASTTQPIGVNWIIKNEGFTDNIEKAKGHHLYGLAGHCPCTAPPGQNCIGSPIYHDHLILGSSYWLDRIYLSKNGDGLDISEALMVKEIKHGTQPFMGMIYPDVITECGYGEGEVNTQTALHAGRTFPTTANFNLPADLDTGSYYVYVYTNPTRTVFEYPGTPQIKRSELPIVVQRPDAIAPTVTVPANSTGGQSIEISYRVMNNGPGVVFNHVRRDKIYISNFPAFDMSAQLIGTQEFVEDLQVGVPVEHTFNYTLPAEATGNKYFYVITNYDSTFKETSHENNTSGSAMTLVSAAIPSDLVVSAMQAADTVFTIFNNNIYYTVTNNGAGATAGTWVDSLFVSCNPVFNPATAFYLGRKEQSRTIANGENYSDTINFNTTIMSYELSSCFPENDMSNAYFFIKTNSNLGTYEAGSINNNVSAATQKVFRNPLVDHEVMRIGVPDTLIVGHAYPVNWTVKNLGFKPPHTYYYSYVDVVYFSTDSVYNTNAVLANSFLKYALINRNDTLRDQRQVVVPNIATGDYYAMVFTNANKNIKGEKEYDNNVNLLRNPDGSARKVHVVRPLLSDLRDTILSAPLQVAVGQPITVINRVTNAGQGATYPNSWKDELYLSSDFTITNNGGDRLLKTRTHNGVLLPGESYLDTITATIPLTTVPGNYVLIAAADKRSDVVEASELNNNGFSLIDVYTPPTSDLIVSEVNAPDTVYLGYAIDSVKWVVQNASANEARGVTRDGIYLSASGYFDSTSALIGIRNKNINMSPLASDSLGLKPLVDNVIEGDYFILVKTDLTDNIPESDKSNNITASPSPIYVKVKELQMNVPENNTLQDVSRYYKLLIPDSLIGSTIMISLKTNDSLTVRNEMFVGGGYIPSAAAFDYRFEFPNYGNQRIVMASVTNPVYYIRISCVSPNPVLQQITLKAEKLPFAILNVNSNSGGNIGNVTVKISGSLFVDGMTSRLSNGSTVINSSAVYFTNSMTVFATFDLRNKPLGIYDVTLIKPDGDEAVLENGFSIVPSNNGGLITGTGPNTGAGDGNEPGCDPGSPSGMNSQLVIDLVVPPKTLLRRPVVIQIHYHNPTNSDVPTQSRVLYSEAGMPLSFTREGVVNGTTSLYLELTEPGGPPGIIRAGGSGTITVYTVAPDTVPPNAIVHFKIK